MLVSVEARRKNTLTWFNFLILFISIKYIIDMTDTSDKNEIIQNGYIAYGFPGESRLFELLSKDH